MDVCHRDERKGSTTPLRNSSLATGDGSRATRPMAMAPWLPLFWLNAGNVEGGHGLIGLRRTRRYSKCSPHGVCFSLHRSERGRALISSARNRRRGSRSSGFDRWPAPHVRDADDKYCTTCRKKSQRGYNYSAYRRGCHDTRPLVRIADSSALKVDPAPIGCDHQVYLTDTPSVSPPDQCSHAMLTWIPSLVALAWLLREAPLDEPWRNPS